MPLTATYRKAARTDIHRIVEFQLAMALETEQLTLDYQTCFDGITAVFDEPSHGQYFVGLSGTVVCSALITYEWSDWRNGQVWWLQSVYVVPELRRQGVYAGLYAHIQSLAQTDDQVRGIRLYVDRRNAVAQETYTRLGMNGEHYSVFEWMKAGK